MGDFYFSGLLKWQTWVRLIIGYNQKTHEILYTDSWGVGHELKRMPEDRAFAITREVFFLRPL